MTEAEVTSLSHGQVLADRHWPAWFTIDQCRAQLMHEAKGCPPPFEGAEWDGYCYRGKGWAGHSSHRKEA